MKKFLIISFCVSTALIIYFFTFRNRELKTPVITQTKTINIAFYSSSNFNASAYNASTVGLNVIVTQIRYNKEKIVWQRNFPFLQLKQFPSINKAFKPRIDLPYTFTNDKFQVSYVLTYNSSGSIIEIKNNQFFSGNDKNSVLNINI